MDGPAVYCFGRRKIFADRRLDKRLAGVFDQLAKHPEGTLPQRLTHRSALVGGYRLLNNRKVTHAAVIAAHRQECLAQLAGYQGRVLLLHDTTVLDYSGLEVAGLGQVGDGHGRGLYAHNSLAVIPETRQVIGLLNQILHQRVKVPKGGELRAVRQARASRESRLWKTGVMDLPALPVGVAVTDVSDRGSDITEYLWHELAAGRQFIVRSQHDRCCVDAAGDPQIQKLHAHLRGLTPAGTYTLTVAAEKGGTRAASMAVSFDQVHLLPPRQARGDHGRTPLALWAVIVRELPRPPGSKEQGPLLEWILLTNRPVTTVAAALGVAEDYACRWMIEDYHKAQKTGCGIEDLQLTTRHGLDNAIAVLSVLAVHVLKLRCLARDPTRRDQPARAHEEELKVKLAARSSRHADWKIMTVWEYYLAVARLGGYMLNPQKRPPGWIIL
jgi:plasmid stabilization system protein ParE